MAVAIAFVALAAEKKTDILTPGSMKSPKLREQTQFAKIIPQKTYS